MHNAKKIDSETMFKLSYGLFVLSARHGDKDNGCIINTATQVTDSPVKISVVVNKVNMTHDMIVNSKEFNISILTESTPFSVFERFGFSTGRDTDKFDDDKEHERTNNGIRYFAESANAVISAKVTDVICLGTHSIFIADVTQALNLSDKPSVTYQYYFDNIKPKPQLSNDIKKGYICKICGYIYEGEVLPEDFICPLCKHGIADFEVIKK